MNKLDRLLNARTGCPTACHQKDNYCEKHPCEYIKGFEEGCEAQLTKTDKEWVEWTEKIGELDKHDSCIVITSDEWQSRKKELGL